jgi:hypothetical protein
LFGRFDLGESFRSGPECRVVVIGDVTLFLQLSEGLGHRFQCRNNPGIFSNE